MPTEFSENHKYVIRDVETKELESSCNTLEEALGLLANTKHDAQFYEIVTMDQYNADEIEYYGVAQSEEEVYKMTTRTPPLCGESFFDPRNEK